MVAREKKTWFGPFRQALSLLKCSDLDHIMWHKETNT